VPTAGRCSVGFTYQNLLAEEPTSTPSLTSVLTEAILRIADELLECKRYSPKRLRFELMEIAYATPRTERDHEVELLIDNLLSQQDIQFELLCKGIFPNGR
jgi:hypothetical protein